MRRDAAVERVSRRGQQHHALNEVRPFDRHAQDNRRTEGMADQHRPLNSGLIERAKQSPGLNAEPVVARTALRMAEARPVEGDNAGLV